MGKVLTEVAAMIDAGQITPEVSKTFTLEDIRLAHAAIEGRHTCGKIGIHLVP
jgi:NADPH:quinone reductase-like Zn-dependent oxidoreductase